MAEKNILRAEMGIPEALTSYAPDLTAPLLHLQGREMANWVNREISIAKSKDPSFNPYIVPKLTDAPWLPPDSDRAAARTRWLSYARKARGPTAHHELSIRAFNLYHLRFLFSADLCGPWMQFGAIRPHLFHLSSVLRIDVTEAAWAALDYHRAVGAKLQDMARKRTVREAEFVRILADEHFTHKAQDEKEVNMAIEAENRTRERDRDPKGAGKGEKGSNPFASRRNNAKRFDDTTRDDNNTRRNDFQPYRRGDRSNRLDNRANWREDQETNPRRSENDRVRPLTPALQKTRSRNCGPATKVPNNRRR